MKLPQKLLQEGDIIELKIGHTVYADVPEHFVFSNKKGSFALVHHNVQIGGEIGYLAGKYIVYKTSMDGGCEGAFGLDGYPNGHHVFCESTDGEVKVDFYQTGCFTAMIKDIDPIGKAVRKWVVK